MHYCTDKRCRLHPENEKEKNHREGDQRFV